MGVWRWPGGLALATESGDPARRREQPGGSYSWLAGRGGGSAAGSHSESQSSVSHQPRDPEDTRTSRMEDTVKRTSRQGHHKPCNGTTHQHSVARVGVLCWYRLYTSSSSRKTRLLSLLGAICHSQGHPLPVVSDNPMTSMMSLTSSARAACTLADAWLHCRGEQRFRCVWGSC